MAKMQILKAGAAKVDITPDQGVQIGGDIGRYRPVVEIRDRLHARVIVVQSGAQTLCVIACDLDCVNRDIGLPLRREIARRIGARPADVMLHSSQCHSAPRVGPFLDDCGHNLTPALRWVRGDTPAYNDYFREALLAGVDLAVQRLEPARIKYARAVDDRCAFNRRFIMRDGAGKTHPKQCDENILQCEGPVDPEMSLLLFEGRAGRPLAGLLHHTCHPTHGYPQRYISADWPGLWSEAVSRQLGGDCVIGCLNGACGNIAPGDHADPGYDRAASLDAMMKNLCQTGAKLIQNLKLVEGLPLQAARCEIKIPWNRPRPAVLAKARKLLREHPSPMFLDKQQERIAWEWVLAIRDLDKMQIVKRQPEYPYEIQVFRIGEVALVGWPGEPFVEAQLALKLRARAKYLMVGHETNGAECGYLPTLDAIRHGGYEVSIGRKLIPGALEKVTGRTIAMVNRLFTGG